MMIRQIYGSYTNDVSLERNIGTGLDILRIAIGDTIVQPLKLKPIALSGKWPSCLEVSHRVMSPLLQFFLDVAWDQGLRPTGHLEDESQVKAMREHLNDMRALVFKGQNKRPEL